MIWITAVYAKRRTSDDKLPTSNQLIRQIFDHLQVFSSYKISPRSTCADQSRQTVPGLTPLTCSAECLVWLALRPAGRSPAGWRRGPCTGRRPVSAALLLSMPSHRSCPAAGPAARPEGAGSPAQNDESWIQILRKTRIIVNDWYSKVCTSVI